MKKRQDGDRAKPTLGSPKPSMGRALDFPALPNHEERVLANEHPVVGWEPVVHVAPGSVPWDEIRERIRRGEPLDVRTMPELGRDFPSDAPFGHNTVVIDPRTGETLYADSVRYVRGRRTN